MSGRNTGGDNQPTYVQFGPGVIALLLEGEPVYNDSLFAYEQREWASLRRQLMGAEDRHSRYRELVANERVSRRQRNAVAWARLQIRQGAQLPPPGLRRPFVHVSTLLADPRPVPSDVVGGFVPAEAIVIVRGTEGIGKSYAMLHLGLCVAAGIPWVGLPVSQRGVLIVDLENQPRRLRERIRKMSHLIDDGEQKLSKLPLATHGMPTSHRLDHPRCVEELAYLAKQADADLIILDSLVDFEGDLDENSNSDMGRVALRLRQVIEETGATILLIHHVPKHLAGKAGQTPRGAIRGTCEVMAGRGNQRGRQWRNIRPVWLIAGLKRSQTGYQIGYMGAARRPSLCGCPVVARRIPGLTNT